MSVLAIETNQLTKRFPGGKTGVESLDLRIRPGVVYGLIGRNGAGKTTALRLLMGLLRADGGSASVLGHDMWRAGHAVRSRVAYIAQAQQLYAWMTLGEIASYVSHFYERWDAAYARNLARRWGLVWDRQVGRMSGGEQRKVSILLAFAARPEVVVLDEPVAGLDPIARRELLDEMVEILAENAGCTFLFSTHMISDLERIAEHVGIMDEGRLITSARLDDLQSTTRRVQVIFPDEVPGDFTIPGALTMRREGPVATAVTRLAHEALLDEIRYLPGVRVTVFPLSLEEIFIEMLGGKPERETETVMA